MPEQHETWMMPSWMEPYREMIRDWGGKPVEARMEGDWPSPVTSGVQFAMALSVRSQVTLLTALHEGGHLK